MTDILHIDFETRSTVDLPKTTTDVYAKDPTTDVWCMAFAFNDEPVLINEHLPEKAGGLTPCWSDDMDRVVEHVENGGLVYGHNVAFEYQIWNKILVPRYGFPELAIEQCRCTMAMAYAMSLPGSLENAAAAAGLQVQKDMAGHRLMLQLARPRKIEKDGTITWWDDPEKLQRLYDYCKQDVETERALHGRLRELSDYEQHLWLLDQQINERGVHVDVDAVHKAKRLAAINEEKLNREIHEVSDGWIGSYTYVNQITDFLRMNGVKTKGIAKADVSALLQRDDLPSAVRRVLQIRQAGAKTSTAKFDTMLKSLSDDNRIRGLFQYHGAGTGRWAGRKVQLHNLPRPSLEQVEIEQILDGYMDDYDAVSLLYGDVLDVLSSCIRGVINAAPGNEFSCLDYSNIEGRVLAWLAGEDWKLRAYEDFDTFLLDENGDRIPDPKKKGEFLRKGPDLYKLGVSGITGAAPEEVSKEQRQDLGKPYDLAFGFEGGVGAYIKFSTMDLAPYEHVIRGPQPELYAQAAENYEQRGKKSGVKKHQWILIETLKLTWRDRHPAIRAFWKSLQAAAIAAVKHPTSVQRVGRIKFIKKGSFLWCQLPSKRLLCYPYPKVVSEETPWGSEQDKLYYKGTDLNRKWVWIDTYGGKLAENVTQAVARDLLADAIVNLEHRSYPVVMHVHDEIVCEAPKGQIRLEDMQSIMETLPVWATGLPIATEGWQGKRYRK